MRIKGLYIGLLFIVFSFTGYAQSIASLELGTTSYAANTTGSATFTTKDPNIASFPALTLTASQQGQAGGAGNVSSKNWFTTTQNTGNYWTFTLTASAGYSIAVTSISIKGQRSATGPTNVALRSDADTYTANIGAQASLQNNSNVINFTGLTLSGLSAVTFRVYGWEATGGAAGGTWRIGDGATSSLDIDVQGNVTANCIAPTIQASGLTITGTTDNQLTLNWSGNGNGDAGVIILAKATSAVSSNPSSSSTYAANSIFGSGSLIGTGNYVVYSGTGSSITITNLTAQTAYYFAIYTYNAAGPCYMTGTPLTGNTITWSNAPTSHALSFAAAPSNCTDVTLTWTAATFPGTGATVKGYMILMRSDGTNPDATNVINTTAPASLSIPAGTFLAGTTTSTALTVTGLSALTTYNFAIIPYTWDSSNGITYDYYTAATIPTTSATTTTTTSSYYYRSKVTGNWNNISTWEASATGAGGWINACSVPTSSAAGITILNGHTVTIDATASAPDLTINNGGTLQANNTSFVNLTIVGNLINDGTLQMFNGTKAVNIIFSKNGNQSITGTGTTTNFYSIGLNMGTSNTNILDISSASFSSSTNLLVNNLGTYTLTNGTIKFSGSYTFANKLFNAAGPTIASTCGIWLNNPNVSITAANYSYTVTGFLRVTSGTFNIGNTAGNSLYLLSNSKLTVEGGTLSVATRIDANTSGGAVQSNVAYRQSGGTVIVGKFQNTHAGLADFELAAPSDSLIMSGGTIIFRNIASQFSDLLHNGYSIITGGAMQFGDASTTIIATGFEIEAGGTFSFLPSLVLNNAASLNTIVYPGTDISVIGNITMNSGTTLNDYWGNYLGINYYYNISLSGNWNNSGTFTHNNQMTVTFNGSAAQFITGTSTSRFNNLTINNSSGGVTLSSPVLMNGTAGILTLTNGYLYTSSINTFTMNAGTSVTGTSNTSFVYGPMSKVGGTDFIFPVGKDAEYRPISATNLSGSETFTAEYFHSDPDAALYDVTLFDPTLNNIGRCEYWILNRAGSTNANVTLSWNDYSCGVTSLTDLAVARWDGSMWKDEGNTATTGAPDPSTGTITSGLVTSFSPFTLASRAPIVNPLPIELLSFTAAYNGEQVDLKWVTATETNNDYFTVERSADASEFREVAITDGAGNSTNPIHYSLADHAPLAGISYYRLKQTDYNGAYTYGATVAVQKNESDFSIVNTNYSAIQGQFSVSFSCFTNCFVTVELFDVSGRKVFSSAGNNLNTSSEVSIPTAKLSQGIYLLKATNGSKLITQKIQFN